MKVLVACEYSGAVRDAFAARGHDAWSCDLLPTDKPGQHIQGDVCEVLGDGWDLMIAHPPCTYLCSSGLHWNKRVPGRNALTHDAMLFVFNLMGIGFIDHGIPRIALENPIGCISSKYRKPDQVIQPWQFGHDASKATCLWLKGLPKLEPSGCVPPRLVCCGAVLPDAVGKYGCPNCNGKHVAKPRWANQTNGGQNKLPPSPDRWKLRSVTYQGIAAAMAEQWGNAQALKSSNLFAEVAA
jgi:hypothetical protein